MRVHCDQFSDLNVKIAKNNRFLTENEKTAPINEGRYGGAIPKFAQIRRND